MKAKTANKGYEFLGLGITKTVNQKKQQDEITVSVQYEIEALEQYPLKKRLEILILVIRTLRESVLKIPDTITIRDFMSFLVDANFMDIFSMTVKIPFTEKKNES